MTGRLGTTIGDEAPIGAKENMTKRISKLQLFKSANNAERQMHAAKIDWHLRRISEAHRAGNRFDVDRHDAAIRDSELRLHQMKKYL